MIQYDLGSGPAYLIAADLNADGFPDLVTANYTDDQISVALNSPPDFTLSPTTPVLSLQRGQQGSEELLIGSNAGFSDAVTLTCSVSGPAPMPTCRITPASVLPADKAQLAVDPGTLKAGALRSELMQEAFFAILLSTTLLGCVLMTSEHKRRMVCLWLFLIMASSVFTLGCGGGGSVAPIVQHYAITIAGTSGAIQHTLVINVTVQ